MAGSKCRHLNGFLFCFKDMILRVRWSSRRADYISGRLLQHNPDSYFAFAPLEHSLEPTCLRTLAFGCASERPLRRLSRSRNVEPRGARMRLNS